ncbi:MAG TPA: hypothetical protein VK183_06345 [Flavobacterium sp.]|nr:hypothetical protein [Flavobacterium sp.]
MNAFLRHVLNFLIDGSFLTGLSAYSLVRLTQSWFGIPAEDAVAPLAFFGTVAGYNFIKYDALARMKGRSLRPRLKAITFFSWGCLVAAGICFLSLRWAAQLTVLGFGALTVLYALPFFPNRQNARNWAGVKIYIVSLCWMGVTAVLPLVQARVPFDLAVAVLCLRRFLFVLVLVLIFEIIDLANDDPLLRTIPQWIGVKRTKQLGHALLILLIALNWTDFRTYPDFILNISIFLLTGFFLFFAHERRPRHYTLLWAESIPILWWIADLLLSHFL